MPASWRLGGEDRVKNVVVERDGINGREAVGIRIEPPTPITNRISRRSHAKRQVPVPTEVEIESDSDSDYEDELGSPSPTNRPFTLTGSPPTKTPAFAIDTALPNPTGRPQANKGPPPPAGVSSESPSESSETISMGERQGGISQGTEHLLIAAGSIGATIVIVMIVLGLYTMRKRKLSFSDVIGKGKAALRKRGNPPPPPKYDMDMDKKQGYDDDYMYVGKDIYPPRPAAAGSRSGSLSTQTPLHPLAQSNSFNAAELNRNNSTGKSFVLGDAPARQPSHRRDISATPSLPLLPIQSTRQSDSTQNTRSLRDEEEALETATRPRQNSALPAPPTFRQFLSNRPSASQRPGLGGGAMASRFSWTNSNAPQTPHDPSRDTAMAAPALGRDSFMTSRSSIPRFRTINSWVNQQSTRIEEQKLKQQFRMTQSTTYSDDGGDSVPEMPPVPKKPEGTEGKVGTGESGKLAVGTGTTKGLKHQRHDTVDTAPIFKAHPGTEVRFSTRSTVPSEVLDMGRRNVAL